MEICRAVGVSDFELHTHLRQSSPGSIISVPCVLSPLVVIAIGQLDADGIFALNQIRGDIVGGIVGVVIVARPSRVQNMIAYLGSVRYNS